MPKQRVTKPVAKPKPRGTGDPPVKPPAVVGGASAPKPPAPAPPRARAGNRRPPRHGSEKRQPKPAEALEPVPIETPFDYRCSICRLAATDYETFEAISTRLGQESFTAVERWCAAEGHPFSYDALRRHALNHVAKWIDRQAGINATLSRMRQAGHPIDAVDAGLRSLQTLSVLFQRLTDDLVDPDADPAKLAAQFNRARSPETLKLIDAQGRNADRLMAAEERKERTRLLKLQVRLAEIMVDGKITGHLAAAQAAWDQVYDDLSASAKLEVDRASESLRGSRPRRRALPA